MASGPLALLISAPARLLIVLIRAYQRVISPILQAVSGSRCRFHPSCSEYAVEALRLHGVVRGLALSTWRLARCQPFARSGLDPVPPRRSAHQPHSPLTTAGATRAR